ncbi:MAG: metallophosphoesterase family protein [Phycisphaerae bacterium]
MKLGILSDSHDQAATARKAITILEQAGAQHFVHCGDVGGVEVFEEFVDKPLTFVWGNCDVPTPGLRTFLQSVGIAIPAAIPTMLTLAGKTLAVFHGHETGFMPIKNDGSIDYILHGHTHVQRDERIDGVRVINPGALFRCQQKTVAILDLETDELTFHDVPS